MIHTTTPSTAPEPPTGGPPPGSQPYSSPSGAAVRFNGAFLTIELRRLAELRNTGVVSGEEFDIFKTRLLSARFQSEGGRPG
jgi:hypothetical protein